MAKQKRFEGTIVLLEGHHSTYIAGLKPSEIEDFVRKGREQAMPFVYLHEPQSEEVDGCMNRVAVDPSAVVGLVADIR